MKKIVLALLLNLFFIANLCAQTLDVRANRTELPIGEAFILTVTTNKETNSAPDFNVLKNDFEVYSVTKAFKSNTINGKSETEIQWQIGLSPVKSGTITIPAIKLDNITSKPMTIKVIEANIGEQIGASDTSDVAKFSIKAEVDNKTPYVQQQVNYIITISDMGGIQGGEPQLIDDSNGDWIIRTLKTPTIDIIDINGKQGREIKMYYALFPQKSGKLTTPQIRFNGYYLTRNTNIAAHEIFAGMPIISDIFATRNPVVLTPESVEVEVEPAINSGKWWTPAKKAEISAKWSYPNQEFKEGEAISRDISLKISGILEKQLPEIRFPEINDVKQYPEKPETKNIVENDEVVSIKKVHNIYIPNRSGKVRLPEISVEWFNVNTGKMEKAIIPETTIDVKTVKGGKVFNKGEENIITTENTSKIETRNIQKESNNLEYKIYSISLGTFALGLLISYLLFRPKKQPKKNHKKSVITAAKSRNFKLLRDELIEWANEHYENANINNLKDIEALVKDKIFSESLNKLSGLLYSDKNTDFNEVKFIRLFEKISNKKVVKKTKKQVLPTLYK